MDVSKYHGELVHRRVIGRFIVTESLFQGGSSLPTHSHASSYFTFTLKGSYRERYGTEWRVCVPGTGVGHPAYESHSQVFGREPVLLLRLAPAGGTEAGFKNLAFERPTALTSPLIARSVWHLHQELQRADEYREMIVEGLAFELAGRALRGATLVGGSRSRAVQALARMRASLRRPPSVSVMASEFGVSRATLYRDFRSAFMSTPGECLRQARIDTAVQALRKSRRNVADIAYECGFYDQSHFTRTFRLALGSSPSEFRSRAL